MYVKTIKCLFTDIISQRDSILLSFSSFDI